MTHQAPSLVRAAFDLGPTCQARHHGEIIARGPQAVERDPSRVVLTNFHLDFRDGSAKRRRIWISGAQIARDHQCLVEAMLREETRREHLRGLIIVRATIVQRTSSGCLRARGVALVAGLTRALKIQARKSREVERACRVRRRAHLVELDIAIADV